MNYKLVTALLATTFFVTGCGTSTEGNGNNSSSYSISYTGLTTPAVLSEENIQDVVRESTSSIRSIVYGDYYSGITVLLESNDESDNTIEDDCLGSDGIAEFTGSRYNGSMVFNDYCKEIGGRDITVNGGMTYLYSNDIFDFHYSDLIMEVVDDIVKIDGRTSEFFNDDDSSDTLTEIEVTINGVNQIVNHTTFCTADYVCVQDSTVQNSDSSVNQFENLDRFGGPTRVYDFTSTFYSHSYGHVELVASDLVLTCANGNISGGDLAITDDNLNTLNVVFNDCNTMTMTFTGVSEIVDQ